MKKIFLNLRLLNISWDPYNGGKSYTFNINLLGFGGGYLSIRHLLYFRIEKFYQWKRPKLSLQILFIKILNEKTI